MNVGVSCSKATFTKQIRVREICQGAHAAYLAEGVENVSYLDLNGGSGLWKVEATIDNQRQTRVVAGSPIILSTAIREFYPEFQGYSFEEDSLRASRLAHLVNLFGVSRNMKVLNASNYKAIGLLKGDERGTAYHDPNGFLDMDLVCKLADSAPGIDLILNASYKTYKRMRKPLNAELSLLDKKYKYISTVEHGWSLVFATDTERDLRHLHHVDSEKGREIMHLWHTTQEERKNQEYVNSIA